jgi:hypothetical protein
MRDHRCKPKISATPWPPKLAGGIGAALLLAALAAFVVSCGEDDLSVGGQIIVPTLPADFTPTP